MDAEVSRDEARESALIDHESLAARVDVAKDSAPHDIHRTTSVRGETADLGTAETAAPRLSGPPVAWPESRHARFAVSERDAGAPEPLTAGALRARVRRRRRVRSWLRTLVVCAAAYLVVFNLSVVRGSSMAPGIHDGDRILVGQWTYLLGDVERGDVVVMSYPVDPRLDYIKRVIGLPGDQVRMSGGEVFVNGERIDEPYVDQVEGAVSYFTTVRPGHYFVLGDNRPHSSDSREFGQVPRELLKGRVDLRVWPLSRAGFVR